MECSAALSRVPTEPEAFASLSDAIRKAYEPLGVRVHVSSLHRSITISIQGTRKAGDESDWHIKYRRLPR